MKLFLKAFSPRDLTRHALRRLIQPSSILLLNERKGPHKITFCGAVLLIGISASLPADATTYTITAPHLTMHVGDPVPPLIFRVDPHAESTSKVFAGEPLRSTTVTSKSAAGDYPIYVSRGSLQMIHPEDRVVFKEATLSVLPPDGIGAQLSNQIVFPPGFLNGPSAHPAIDVTHNDNAILVGDCLTDNAQAFDRLLSQSGARTRTTTNGGAIPLYLYFPPGCYATSQPLTIYGNSWTLWGSGPQISYIRLLPHSAAFNTGHITQFFSPQSVTGNSNFREYIYNLGVNIGAGNPDAIPLTTIQNNSGAIRNVQVWADDSACPYAVSLTRAYPGPMLFKNVAIYGCAMAYSAGQGEYNITLEGITTEGQTAIVFDNHFFKASIRHWLSDNTVTALHAYGSTTANVSLLDSEILNGSPTASGVLVDKGSSVYLANLKSTGYSPTETDSGSGQTIQRWGSIKQAWTGVPQTIFNHPEEADSLHLPVSETPLPLDPPMRQWTQLSWSVSDWPNELSHAKSSTVYAAPGIYQATGTIEIPVGANINHLEFFQSKFSSGKPQIILTISDNSSVPLVIDGCIYESCQIRHWGKRTLVLRDTTLYSYTAQEGSGDFYVEDSVLNEGSNGSIPLNFYSSQHIWARQLNLEQKGSPKLKCRGCSLWVLGYKTEQSSPSLILSDGAMAEVFGFFFYQNAPPTGTGSASIYLTDSSLFATGWMKVDVPGRGQPNWVIETRSEKSGAIATHDVDSSQQLNVFFSHGIPLSQSKK